MAYSRPLSRQPTQFSSRVARAATAATPPPGPAGAFDGDTAATARRSLFNKIAADYDYLNDALSFGQHRVWKRMAVSWSRAAPGQAALDVCCGSGDLAALLATAVGSAGTVTGLDFSADMLSHAAEREAGQQLRGGSSRAACKIRWLEGDAMRMPLADASFDAATMGYGLRNVRDIPAALSGLHRVLRPGSYASILDFNNSANPVIDGIQGALLDSLVVPAARERGLAEEYEYLRPSIKAFPSGMEQEELAKQAGFAEAIHYELSFGLMGCLVVRKGL